MFGAFLRRPALKLPMFWVVVTVSGLLGLAISFTSMWFMHQTSPTTHRYVSYVTRTLTTLCAYILIRAWCGEYVFEMIQFAVVPKLLSKVFTMYNCNMCGSSVVDGVWGTETSLFQCGHGT